MSGAYEQGTLDCQDCGDVVRRLSPSEAQEVAQAPYSFIVYCELCRADRAREQMQLEERE